MDMPRLSLLVRGMASQSMAHWSGRIGLTLVLSACGDSGADGLESDGSGTVDDSDSVDSESAPTDSADSPSGSDVDTTDTEWGETDSSETGMPPLESTHAAAIAIDEVILNQAVDITLGADGAVLDAAQWQAPPIANRPALVRASYTLADDFVPRTIVGQLRVIDGARSLAFLDEREVSGPGDPTQLGGTFEWRIGPSALSPSAELVVELLEADPDAPSSPPDGSRWPSEGSVALEPWTDMTLELVIVPFSCPGLDAPEVTGSDRDDLEAFLYDVYPVAGIDITVHDPLHSDSCDEYEVAEYTLPELRMQEGAEPGVYYGGLMAGDGGGYSIWVDPSDMASRRSFASHTWRDYGLTFDLFAHELGHNHGRPHSFEDPDYPAATGDWCGQRSGYGHGMRSGMMPETAFSNDQDIGLPWIDPSTRLLAPTLEPCDGLPNGNQGNFNDIMSYAYPYWVSDYTYRAIAEVVRSVAAWDGAGASMPARSLVRVRVDEPGHRPRRTLVGDFRPDRSVRCEVAGTTRWVPAREVEGIWDRRVGDRFESIEVVHLELDVPPGTTTCALPQGPVVLEP